MKKGILLDKMLVLAVNAHSGQFDRGGKPYILHCLTVSHFVGSEDEELQCVAVGHDIIEDTDVTYQDLKDQGFSKRIIDGIRALTKVPGQTFEEYKEGIFANKDAMLVKLQDLRHNSDIRRLKGVTEKDLARTQKYHELYNEIKEKLNAERV